MTFDKYNKEIRMGRLDLRKPKRTKRGRPKQKESIYTPGVLFPTFNEAKTRIIKGKKYRQGAYSDEPSIRFYEEEVLKPSKTKYKITKNIKKWQVWIKD